MFTAPNPGLKTLDGTHTFIVGHDEAYVIDPGPDIEAYKTFIAGWLQANAVSLRGILLSHGHPDHAPGAMRLKTYFSVPVLASDRMPDAAAREFGVDRPLADGQKLSVDGDVLQVLATPGHTPEHLAFWLVKARILFSADAILGRGTSVIAPPEGDMRQYMRSLEIMRQLGARIIAPGHGPLVHDPDAKIEEYIEHRRQREEEIQRALRQGAATVQEIVARVYTDVDPRLHALAEGSVRAQLAKLMAEGRIGQSGDRYILLDASW